MIDSDAADVGVQVEAVMKRAAQAARDAAQAALGDAAKVATVELEGLAVVPTGGDLKFSRFYPRAQRLVVRTRLFPGVLLVAPRGAWALAEDGADPHQAKAWGRGSFDHPGTSGTLAWSRGREATFARIEADLPDEVGGAVERAVEGV